MSPNRYPGYDVLAKRRTPSWNEPTRQVIDRRLAVSRDPRALSEPLYRVLQAVCDRIVPQPSDRPPVPTAAYIDQKLANEQLDGYRFASLPEQDDAWRRGLQALDNMAQRRHQLPFVALSGDQQDSLLQDLQDGKLQDDALGDMNPAEFFKQRLLKDIVSAYYAHPSAWNDIGFGGPASPRGYVRMGLNRRDPWEAAEAKPGEEEIARRDNRHVV